MTMRLAANPIGKEGKLPGIAGSRHDLRSFLDPHGRPLDM